MSDSRREIEVRGQDVEAAIENGLRQLNTDRGNVIVDILDEGNRGLLGIGSRDAVVRLSLLSEEIRPARVPSDAPPAEPVEAKADFRSQRMEAEGGDGEDEAAGEETAVRIVEELLTRMQVDARVTTRKSEPDDLTGRRITILDVEGNDLGSLIGPRGETLNAFQHITRLMASHQMRQRADFVIDVEGYRKRREQALTRLAERMAQKVADRQRAISLEPMPPNERRIIHVALRDDDNVYTQSAGEGNRRRVRILPKTDV